ncbi:hypothetical protein FRC06_007574, partial [Ceratobasidium sp. 370]
MPFGLVGRFATKGFRRRLRDHYYAPGAQQDQAKGDTTGAIKIDQFLLDYVLDLGPATVTTPPEQYQDGVESARSDVELDDVRQLPGHGIRLGNEHV